MIRSLAGPGVVLSLIVAVLIGLTVPPAGAAGRTLTFEERVAAQEAIERVYYSHQIGTTKPFEEAVPRELFEKKVGNYLKQSVALEQFWRTSVTGQMLRAELERIARNTRFPERLVALYSALDNDPLTIEECFARPVLVDRLTRSFFAYDERIQAEAEHEAQALYAQLTGGVIQAASPHPYRAIMQFVRADATPPQPTDMATVLEGFSRGQQEMPHVELTAETFDRLRTGLPEQVGQISPVDEGRDAFHVRVVLSEGSDRFELATFSVPKLRWDAWWEEAEILDAHVVDVVSSEADVLPPPAAGMNSGDGPSSASASGCYAAPESTTSVCVPDDTWDNGVLDDLPDHRSEHTAIWTGSLMIVWGGRSNESIYSGGRYDPLTDVWSWS